MNITKNNPKPVGATLFNDLFQDLFGQSFFEDQAVNRKFPEPLVNISEEKDRFLVELAVPGVKKENIKIDVEKEHLIIKSAIGQTEASEDKYTKKEFFYGSFEKSFYIPESVNTNQIEASFEDGILKVELMKKEEAVDNGPKHIEVK